MTGRSTPSATMRAVGSATHAAVGELAQRRDELSSQLVLRVAARHARDVASSTRSTIGSQHVAPLCGIAVRLFPPRSWRFVGCEVPAERGAVDVVWAHEDHGVLVDELKVAGLARVVEDARTRGQVDSYRRWGVGEFGDTFLGVRLLTLSGPLKSRWYPPLGAWSLLVDSPWWFGFAADLRAGSL